VNKRLAVTLAGLVAATVVLAEVLLHPAADDRWQLLIILIGPVLIAAALTPVLTRWVSSRASVTGVALAVGFCSLALGAVTSSAASNAMFVSSHDYRLFLVVLVLSSGISLVVADQLTRPITRDVRRLGEVAQQVAGGDLSVSTGIHRNDEVGAAATALDQMIEALRAAETERERLSAARQHLFTSLGHDLRTPLSAMQASVESLEDGVAADPARALAVLAAQLRTLDTMLDQVIEFSRLESGHSAVARSSVSLAELADESVEALTPLARRRNIDLAVVTDGPAHVNGSPLELARVIRNLTDNAVRHSPDDGTVTIAIAATADVVRVSVTDEGDGFPDEFRAVAFEPFQRADPSRNARTGNTGLGLAICRAIITSHHGRIWLGDGPGAAVHLELPGVTR
jgi:two-component system, OmpR family, sensor histidine kinase BaeS